MLNKELIALRLTEAWVGQQGNPANMYSVVENYKYALEEVNKIEEDK